ncbi:MAG TPA: asparaginase [Gemmatimonadales bacterium]
MPSVIEVSRGDLIESRHHVSIAVVRADGVLVGSSGDPDVVSFWRSCAKPFQAVPMIAEGAAAAYAFAPDALALACASHNGEARHVALARQMLAASGSSESDLVCGPHASLNDDVAKAMVAKGEKPTKAHNNCSGKHAGMIALARHSSWPVAGYALPEHPVQQRCLTEVARWTGLDDRAIPHATDGCGVPSFALPLKAMALAWARLGSAFAGDRMTSFPREVQIAAGQLLGAMRGEPFLIAGTGRLDTEIMSAAGGKVIAKVGAEGVYCASIPEQRLGLALKVEDGATRCLGPALLGLLDILLPRAVQGLDEQRRPAIRNTLGADVGRIEPRIVLDRAASRR